jgi:hypothetical protein
MTDKLQSFIHAADSTIFGSRDIVVGEDSKEVKLGRLIIPTGSKANERTMSAFRKALSEKYGVFGEHAFDTTLSSRSQRKKSLRACDIKATISNIEALKIHRVVNEFRRQVDTDPKFRELPQQIRLNIKAMLNKDPCKGLDLKSINDLTTLSNKVSERLDELIKLEVGNESYKADELGDASARKVKVEDTDATGLSNLNVIMEGEDTSVEDSIKKGTLGAGMTINRSETDPIILVKLKDNGVEPGFIYKNDWSLNDTKSLMMDYTSEESEKKLNEILAHNDELRNKCSKPDLTLRDKIMLCGNAHPACVSAVADYMIEEGMKDKNSEIYKAFEDKFPHYTDYTEVENDILKKELFVQIRNAVLNVKVGSDDYKKSPIFQRFNDRHIMKLDYNENDRIFIKKAAHAGKFMRPERIATRKFGTLYRLQSAQKADDISSGAVAEALANDLSRILGVPTQDLRIVRGKYSDGHPKIMLQAKFSEGYEDLEKGYIKDGRIVLPDHLKGKQTLEKLGKYKAFFLTTADRDGIGSHGQNKGFANGKFFAIDPGHSLEGNGRFLEVNDNLTFKDNYGFSLKPRFNNFSIFDDDTRFAKLQGVLTLREAKQSGKIDKLFNDYRTAFDANEPGISDAEKALRFKIQDEINVKEKEFYDNMQKILNVSDGQLHFYDDLKNDGPETQKNAIETIENLEKLTSPTTWVSDDGTVALDHLNVKPETRVPWQAHVDGDSLVYHCDEPLSPNAKIHLEAFAKAAGVQCELFADGTAKITVQKDQREMFFKTFDEEKIQNATHPNEAAARNMGEDGLEEAKKYVSPLTSVPQQNSQGLGFEIPASITVRVGNSDVVFNKEQYEAMLKDCPPAERPHSIDAFKNILQARINKGREIMKDVLAGNGYRHQCTPRNAACLTLAFHAATRNKNEQNDLGSFSVEDPKGRLYQWLDTCKDIYMRTSTHAKYYHHMFVDGHMNMPRGLDVPEGMGGLMNGMKTFHYFTLPQMNGQPRRLFLKTETHGIYYSTISKTEEEDSRIMGMQTRQKRSSDIKESILHCASLMTVFTRKGDGFGNRKENVPKTVLDAVSNCFTQLMRLGNRDAAIKLKEGVDDNENGGIRKILENLMFISSNFVIPQMPGLVNGVVNVIHAYADELDEAGNKKRTGDVNNRIGNEVMLDNKDFDFNIA